MTNTVHISSATTSKGGITKRCIHCGNNNKFTLINEMAIFMAIGMFTHNREIHHIIFLM